VNQFTCAARQCVTLQSAEQLQTARKLQPK
jgi:hypothetical protein